MMVELTIHEIVLWLAGVALLVGIASYAARMRQKEQNMLEKRRLDAVGKIKSKNVQSLDEDKDQKQTQQLENPKFRFNNK